MFPQKHFLTIKKDYTVIRKGDILLMCMAFINHSLIIRKFIMHLTRSPFPSFRTGYVYIKIQNLEIRSRTFNPYVRFDATFEMALGYRLKDLVKNSRFY
jgi:hypothetical protein